MQILQIYHLKAHGMKVLDNVRKTGRSRASIYRILSKGDNFEAELRSGRPKKQLSGKTERFSDYCQHKTCLYAQFPESDRPGIKIYGESTAAGNCFNTEKCVVHQT